MKPKRNIIKDDILLRMVAEGIEQKDIAAHFGCSPQAVSKRLRKLNPIPEEPLKIDALTPKEKAFVVAVASGESKTNAALRTYECSSRPSAKSLGHTLMEAQGIREALQEILDREIPIDHLIKRLRQHIDAPDPNTSLRAVDMGLKAHNAYPSPISKNLNVNLNADASPIDLQAWMKKQWLNRGRDDTAPEGEGND